MMATYSATLMHAARGGEGIYEFEAEDGMIARSAMSTLRAFMDHISGLKHLDLADWHVNSVRRNAEKGVVTGMGDFEFAGGELQPFVCFIKQV